MAVATKPWRNRIVGEGEEDPTQLLANPLNWRIHPTRQREAMRGALDEVGWVQRVIVNQRTGHVIDGHLRIEEAISADTTVPVLYVDLTEDEERVVLATLDPLGAMAGQSDERLHALLQDVAVDSEALIKMIERLTKDSGDAYTDTIKTPLYEPTGERPDISALRDETKADSLRARILEAMPEDSPERAFLLAAAGRHTVFDYRAIAEWYAHAEPEIQTLMEDSALVIIDYEDAIRDGYVKFVQTLETLSARDVEADADED